MSVINCSFTTFGYPLVEDIGYHFSLTSDICKNVYCWSPSGAL
jgi:hypothetical protein